MTETTVYVRGDPRPMLIGSLAASWVASARELDEFTTETRMLVWGEAYLGWQQHPWIGLGTTNFAGVMGNFGILETDHAHNTYLQILVESGLIGLALFYVPLVYLLCRAWRARSVPIAFAGVSALMFWLVHAFVDYKLAENPPCLLLLFTVVGLIISGLQPKDALARAG